mmetsp:Transcript_13136/g.20807  ORF Transcript_13136/g.20807 Transcript_13136/m.20807 type:complete len:115 (-) Transcript_13136:224-568(-)
MLHACVVKFLYTYLLKHFNYFFILAFILSLFRTDDDAEVSDELCFDIACFILSLFRADGCLDAPVFHRPDNDCFSLSLFLSDGRVSTEEDTSDKSDVALLDDDFCFVSFFVADG